MAKVHIQTIRLYPEDKKKLDTMSKRLRKESPKVGSDNEVVRRAINYYYEENFQIK